MFKKSHSQVPNQFGHKSTQVLNQFGKKFQQANSKYNTIHNIIDTVHKVKSILEK